MLLGVTMVACSSESSTSDGGTDSGPPFDAGGGADTSTTNDSGGGDAGVDVAVDAGPLTVDLDGGTKLALTIPNDTYNGTKGTMACATVMLPADPLRPKVWEVKLVRLGASHNFVGDLTAKVFGPNANGTAPVVTLFSRPQISEAMDNGASPSTTNASNLNINHPIEFSDSNSDNPETMGMGLASDEFVCGDDNRCKYKTNPGSAMAGTLASFKDITAAGTWSVCIGDSDNPQASLNTGTLEAAQLQIVIGP